MKISTKKAADPVVKTLPMVVVLIIAAVLILIMIYMVYKGGLGTIAKPPTTKLPV